jgi:hypothetical protein
MTKFPPACNKWLFRGLAILAVWLVFYAFLATGLWLLHSGWIPWADSLLGGRHIHSFGHYRRVLTGLYIRFSVIVALLILIPFIFMAWVRFVGGWRRFLPRFAFLLAFTCILAEVVLRLAFVLPAGTIPSLQQPSLLADSFTDDAFWVLTARLNRHEIRDYVHPTMGWGQVRPTPDNPIGLKSFSHKALSSDRPLILFFGDSFVRGMPFNENSLPQMVAKGSPHYEVVNLGVRGYGVDQMYLQSREIGMPATNGEVWVGILTWDLDRAYLEYSYGQKPRYRIKNGILTLPNVPIKQLDQKFIDGYKMPFRSWLIQAIRRKRQIHQGLERGGPERDEKIAINRAILRDWSAWCRDAGIPLRVILFHTRQDIAQDSWRSRAVKKYCEEFGLPMFDTADVLMPYLEKTGSWGEELYEKGDFHHTDLANKLIAEWLVTNWVRAGNKATLQTDK